MKNFRVYDKPIWLRQDVEYISNLKKSFQELVYESLKNRDPYSDCEPFLPGLSFLSCDKSDLSHEFLIEGFVEGLGEFLSENMHNSPWDGLASKEILAKIGMNTGWRASGDLYREGLYESACRFVEDAIARQRKRASGTEILYGLTQAADTYGTTLKEINLEELASVLKAILKKDVQLEQLKNKCNEIGIFLTDDSKFIYPKLFFKEEKEASHMIGGVQFNGPVTFNGSNGNISIGDSQYNFNSDSKEKLLTCVADIMKESVDGADILPAIQAFSKDTPTRTAITTEEIAKVVEQVLAQKSPEASIKQRLKDLAEQLATGASGSILGSGIIMGIKIFLGLPA